MVKELAGQPVSRVLFRIPHPNPSPLGRGVGVRDAATIISLVRRSPGGSSSLPGSRNGPDQPCSHIWPCSRWGLPSQPVTRLLVRSYIKDGVPHLFTLTQARGPGGILSVALSLSFARRCRRTRTVGVTHHRVLWSPDFPLPEPRAEGRGPPPVSGSDRLAGPRIQRIIPALWTGGVALAIKMIEVSGVGFAFVPSRRGFRTGNGRS